MNELLDLVQGVQPILDKEDNFVWWTNENGFSVKNNYIILSSNCDIGNLLEGKTLTEFDKLGVQMCQVKFNCLDRE